ncbi:hypothetical protein C8J56DRAFT_801798 [Mycena floridula]|nr:hypothetical protein C8J56DRAFT_801798 [Mycena floridula]
MKRWKLFVPRFLDELCRWDGRGDCLGQAVCSTCQGLGLRLFRCKDCSPHALVCQRCLVGQHERHPLHLVEVWDDNRRLFYRVSLKSLGLKIQLGHEDHGTCYLPEPTKNFIILHSNGIHDVQVDYCGCASGKDHWIQLLRHRLYPATVDQPNTAATFACLDEGVAHGYAAQETSYEYYKILEQLTDNTGLKPLNSRQDELQRMMRQWRWLHMLKRAGRAHALDGVEGTPLGGCAIVCPACPHPGINLPEGWDKLPEDIGWIYRLFVGNDADFKIKRRDVSSEEKDPGLCQGHAYFVEQTGYDAYLEANKGVKQAASKCVSHDAVNKADRKEVRGLKVTGLATVDCTRHEMKRPNGLAALQKGERYVNIDFIVWMSLWFTMLNFIVMSYDIMCQYSVNFYSRMSAVFGESTSRIHTKDVQFIWTVPKFHLPAHIQSCWQSFNFNYTRWTGRSDGEAVERGWSWLNRLRRSIKEMGPGSWRDTIEDHVSFHNWQKVTGMGRSLLRKLHVAVPKALSCQIELVDMAVGIDQASLVQWEAEVLAYEANSKIALNPYAPRARRGSLATVRLKLLEEEAVSLQTNLGLIRSDISASAMIQMGLEFEESQLSLREEAALIGPHATAHQKAAVQGRANSLQRKILSWFDVQALYAPDALLLRRHHEETTTLDNKTFDMGLWLPSSIGTKARCSKELQGFEWQLRTAQANDALDAIRTCLRLKGYLFRDRRTNVEGVAAGTRSMKAISNAEVKIAKFQTRYSIAFSALQVLAPLLQKPESWRLYFRPLAVEDVRPLPADRVTGEKDTTLSWIWKMPGVADKDDPAVHDGNNLRLQWLRARARSNRWSEELVLLKEEMRRVLATMTWQATWWRAQRLRQDVDPALMEGLVAYSERQAILKEALRDQNVYLWRLCDDWIAAKRVPTERRWVDETVKPKNCAITIFHGVLLGSQSMLFLSLD